MKKYFKQVKKINNDEVKLIKISGKNFEPGIIRELGLYEGHNFYDTDEIVNIDYFLLEDKKLKITAIESCSFSHCRNLKEIHIASHITKISWNMFECSKLINIFVEPNNPYYHDIKGVLFSGSRNKLKLEGFPSGRIGSYIIPNGTREIGNFAFKSSQLSNIILPDSLIRIGINAFYNCKNLHEIILPEGIKHIEENKNQGKIDITQNFYFKSDFNKTKPFSISELIAKFKNQ